MKINYPIKYALMPIVEQVGWNNGVYGLERNYDTICYIVSKCYLVGEKIKYNKNGEKSKNYQVVFPYTSYEFNRWKRILPNYNVYGSCSDCYNVDTVFNTYDAAEKYCAEKNNEVREKLTLYIPFTEDYVDKVQEKLNEFDYRLANYKRLEEIFRDNTYDMKVYKNKKLKDVIKVLDKNKGHMLSTDLYKLIEILDSNKYLIYSLKDEEYDRLINMINNDEEYDILNFIRKSTPLLAHSDIKGPTKVIDDSINGEYYIKSGKLFYNDEGIMQGFSEEKIDPETLIFLTNETTDDILKSYKVYDDIEFKYVDDEEVLKKYLVKNNKK